MAPEVIKGESVNYLLDFWSLGVIGYEFLTGNLPFNDETPSKIFNNILEKEIEWPPIG
jgi:serine/threonine protein kinase